MAQAGDHDKTTETWQTIAPLVLFRIVAGVVSCLERIGGAMLMVLLDRDPLFGKSTAGETYGHFNFF